MSSEETQASGTSEDERWFTRSVAAIGGASFFADLGYEMPTSLLPSFLTSTLGAPAAALGLIEGFADGLGGVSRLAGGAIADDPARRVRHQAHNRQRGHALAAAGFADNRQRLAATDMK